MTGIQRKKRIKWWIYLLSPFIIFLVWGLFTIIFWYIKWSWISGNIERLQLIQTIINFILAIWSIVTTVLMVIWSVWIIRYSDDPEYHPYIWNHKKISELSDTEIELAKRHNIKKRFSPIWAVILNLLTLWIANMEIFLESEKEIWHERVLHDLCLYLFFRYIGSLDFG